MIQKLKQQVLDGTSLTLEQARILINIEDKESLYKAANEITHHFMEDKFDTCSIINAKSGNCSEDCKWCSQSAHNKAKISTYPLLPAEECVRHALANRKQGINRFALVTSGKRISVRETEELVDIVHQIKESSDTKVCASMGLLKREQLQQLFDAGIENYHCNIETAPSNFSNLCTTHTIAQKMETLNIAREIGFRVCCGGIIGMGETMEQRVEMALFLQEAKIYSIPINILQPIPGTPLGDTPFISDEDILTTIALFRFINPNAYLRFSGGRGRLSIETQRKALFIGVNAAIMGDLLTTIGSKVKQDKELFTSEGYSLIKNTDW